VIRAARVLALVFVAIGLALLVETTILGGGQVGYLAGAVFLLLGILRWRATSRTRP
jgi:hypothetical protein